MMLDTFMYIVFILTVWCLILTNDYHATKTAAVGAATLSRRATQGWAKVIAGENDSRWGATNLKKKKLSCE